MQAVQQVWELFGELSSCPAATFCLLQPLLPRQPPQRVVLTLTSTLQQSQATAMVFAQAVDEDVLHFTQYRHYEVGDAVASLLVSRNYQNQAKYITHQSSTGYPWGPGALAEHLEESIAF
jgi:hypothetical protein